MPQEKSKFTAFTAKANGILREIVIDSGVSLPFIPNNPASEKTEILKIKALWDTGATGCVITKDTATALKLEPISMVKVCHAGGESLHNAYLINIYLPNNVVVSNVRVTECEDTTGKFGLIIGMNIITLGDFSVTNVGGNTTVSFRMPSIETIDYVEEINKTKVKSKPHTAPKKVGRNDLCPCGSGKKYKNCCGKGE